MQRKEVVPTPPSAKALFDLYRRLVALQDAMYAGGETVIATRLGDMAACCAGLMPSTSSGVTALGELVAGPLPPNVAPSTRALIVLAQRERIAQELEAALASADVLLTPPYASPPYDDATRKTLGNRMIHLWGCCGAQIPDYDKRAWNGVMGQLKQIGAIDW